MNLSSRLIRAVVILTAATLVSACTLSALPVPQETVFATELRVGNRFMDEIRKQEGIVEEVDSDYVKYRLVKGAHREPRQQSCS